MTNVPDSISVVTVTYNCADLLSGLVDNLRQQSDRDFEWVIVDGASTDTTVSVIAKAAESLRIRSISEPDFGIYHALNKAVSLVETDYYVVVGADDELSHDAIARYRQLASMHRADLVAASVTIGPRVVRAGQGKQWLRGGNAHVASHSVGTLIRTSLHRRFGLYSNRFVNCADMLFVLTALNDPRTKIVSDTFLAGKFCVDGISTVDRICSLSDFFRIQLRFESRPFLQLALYMLRLVRLAPSLLHRQPAKARTVPPSLSVVTATYNCLPLLRRLAASLLAQTSESFHWIVVDGASNDGTAEFMSDFAAQHTWCCFTTEPDFGIYDALNKGITRLKTEYYVVAGADDQFSPTAMEHYSSATTQSDSQPDFVLAKVMINGRVCGSFRPERAWLGHQQVFGGSHSVGMLIRASVHQKLGRYSNRFPMLADGLFLKRALKHPDIRFSQANFIAGEFALGGLSSSGKLQSLAEGWQIQMLTEQSRFLQILLFITKITLRLPVLLRPEK